MKNLKIDIANFFVLIILLNIILHYFLPIRQIVFYPYRYLGIVFFILGWIPNIWLGIYFRKINNPTLAKEKPHKLITSGLFSFSRNPVYLGMIIALFGEAIFLGSLITFVLPVLFFILIKKINIQFEEEILKKKFGKKYTQYKLKVRRWI